MPCGLESAHHQVLKSSHAYLFLLQLSSLCMSLGAAYMVGFTADASKEGSGKISAMLLPLYML